MSGRDSCLRRPASDPAPAPFAQNLTASRLEEIRSGVVCAFNQRRPPPTRPSTAKSTPNRPTRPNREATLARKRRHAATRDNSASPNVKARDRLVLPLFLRDDCRQSVRPCSPRHNSRTHQASHRETCGQRLCGVRDPRTAEVNACAGPETRAQQRPAHSRSTYDVRTSRTAEAGPHRLGAGLPTPHSRGHEAPPARQQRCSPVPGSRMSRWTGAATPAHPSRRPQAIQHSTFVSRQSQ
jgi:hypothetical protein